MRYLVPSGDSTIQHVAGEPVPLVDFGLSVLPADGWTYLKVNGKDADGSMTLVNESERAIVVIKPYSFHERPPQLVTGGNSENGVKRLAGTAEPKTTKYKLIAVDWYVINDLTYAYRCSGRIDTERQELLIQAFVHRGASVDPRAVIGKLCDQIGQLH